MEVYILSGIIFLVAIGLVIWKQSKKEGLGPVITERVPLWGIGWGGGWVDWPWNAYKGTDLCNHLFDGPCPSPK